MTHRRIILTTGIEGHQFSTIVMTIFSRIQMALAMEFLMTPETKRYQILCRVIAQTAPWLNVMDLKIFRTPAELAMPSVAR